MQIPTPTATRNKFKLLQRNGGELNVMEPLEQVIIKFIPTGTYAFLQFNRSMKAIIQQHLTHKQTREMRKSIAKFIDRFAEPDERQELARLMRLATEQAQKERDGN